MTGFGIGSAIVLNDITSQQLSQWYFVNFLVLFGLPKLIFVGADGIFEGMFNNNYQESLHTPLHAVARGNHNSIINEGFHLYLEKFRIETQPIKSVLANC